MKNLLFLAALCFCTIANNRAHAQTFITSIDTIRYTENNNISQEFYLIHFNQICLPNEICTLMDTLKLKPGTMADLCILEKVFNEQAEVIPPFINRVISVGQKMTILEIERSQTIIKPQTPYNLAPNILPNLQCFPTQFSVWLAKAGP